MRMALQANFRNLPFNDGRESRDGNELNQPLQLDTWLLNYSSYCDIIHALIARVRRVRRGIPRLWLTEGSVIPLAWFYISVVTFLYALLFYSEMRARAKRHVKGCPSLPYISPVRLGSLITIEPNLFIIELSSRVDSGEIPQLPDALRMPLSQLEKFLQTASCRSVFVFYDTTAEPVTWSRVERIVNDHAMHNVYILKGGHELWLSKHRADEMADATWIAGRNRRRAAGTAGVHN